jgi:hypothetical protein
LGKGVDDAGDPEMATVDDLDGVIERCQQALALARHPSVPFPRDDIFSVALETTLADLFLELEKGSDICEEQ